MNRYKLNELERFHFDDRRGLLRSLLKEVLGEETLSELNASTISTDVLHSIESKKFFTNQRF